MTKQTFFKGLCICTTGLSADLKEKLKHAVISHGGMYDEDLTNQTTHLLATIPGSAKFSHAMKTDIFVVKVEWVFDSVENQQRQEEKSYEFPIFAGLIISTTGLFEETKQKILAVVEQNGGKYVRNLEVETTHLLAEVAEGPKYDAASDWQIPILRPQWIFDCAEKQAYLSEADYSLHAQENTAVEQPASVPSHIDRQLTLEINEFLSQNNDTWNRSLEFCSVYFFKADREVELLLSALVRHGMGSRFLNLNQLVTHIVVMPDAKQKSVKQLQLTAPNTIAVTPRWLLESCRQGTKASEYDFIPTYKVSIEHPQAATSINQQPEHAKKGPEELPVKEVPLQRTDSDIIPETQLSLNSSAATCTLTPVPSANVVRKKNICRNRKLLVINALDQELYQDLNKIITDEGGSSIEISVDNIRDAMLYTLSADGFPPALPEENFRFIVVASGTILDQDMLKYLKTSYPEAQIGTELWLQCCIRESRTYIIKSQRYFYDTTETGQLFSDYRVEARKKMHAAHENINASISGYTGSERAICYELSRLLGIRYTKKMNKRNTHLICNKAAGPKYTKAREWGFAIVNMQWLVACAHAGYAVSTTDEKFTVVEDKVISQKENIDMEPTVSKIENSEPTALPDARVIENTFSNNAQVGGAVNVCKRAPVVDEGNPNNDSDDVQLSQELAKQSLMELNNAPTQPLSNQEGNGSTYVVQEETDAQTEYLSDDICRPATPPSDNEDPVVHNSVSLEKVLNCTKVQEFELSDNRASATKDSSCSAGDQTENAEASVSTLMDEKEGHNFPTRTIPPAAVVEDVSSHNNSINEASAEPEESAAKQTSDKPPGHFTQLDSLLSQLGDGLTLSLEPQSDPYQAQNASRNSMISMQSISASSLISRSRSTNVNPKYFENEEEPSHVGSQWVTYECPVEANNRTKLSGSGVASPEDAKDT